MLDMIRPILVIVFPRVKIDARSRRELVSPSLFHAERLRLAMKLSRLFFFFSIINTKLYELSVHSVSGSRLRANFLDDVVGE